jgi:hypothetical protein
MIAEMFLASSGRVSCDGEPSPLQVFAAMDQ